MNNDFPLEQISKTGTLVVNLIPQQKKIDFMARFMEIKSLKPYLGQSELAEELVLSSSTLQRFRHDLEMQSPMKQTLPEEITMSQLTSKDLKRPQKYDL